MSDTAGDGITIVPANETSWDDIRAVFGTRGTPAGCQCQSFKVRDKDWRSVPVEDRADRLREQTHCGDPGADTTSGLVAYLDGEPAGWCAVEPRTAYVRLLQMRVPWTGRDEDRSDDGVWAVTCFVTRTGFRRRGVSRALARAAAEHARGRGARAVEGYAMITEPGQVVQWGELYVGSRSVYEAAGFTEVSHPTPRRVVMRIDF
jgi:GNAT superfamily N-acetyltransferase